MKVKLRLKEPLIKDIEKIILNIKYKYKYKYIKKI